MAITSISIRNFRSIVLLNEKVCDLNIFVGQNDDGKSNILRALDLFFNHDKRTGYDLNWQRDYCCFAPNRMRKAEEIIIELTIVPPVSFANQEPVVWRKVWRRDGLHEESSKYKNGKSIAASSKAIPFLKAMRFDYVPAIKGKEYFQALMADLHDMLESTVEDQIRNASGSFTETINANTKPILLEIAKRLSLETTIELPGNLRDLFAQLEFTSVSGERSFSLDQRGDGIKVRHIPIVLKWLAEQSNHLSSKGRPKSVTVWGYEEPENNLELRRCFDMATDFVESSPVIQSFVTTHSPAFYSVFRNSDIDKVALFQVTKDQQQAATKLRRLKGEDMQSLDGAMGLMTLLEPHFHEARKELNHLRSMTKKLQNNNRPTIFCEGPTDKALFEHCIRNLFPSVADRVAVRCSDENGGGHGWVADMMIAWSFSRPGAKAVGVFDKDSDAQRTMKETQDKLKNPHSGKQVYAVALHPNHNLRQCYPLGFNIPFALEELLPESVWDYAESKSWLQERTNPIALYGFSRTDVTFRDHIDSLLTDPHLKRLVLYTVKRTAKEPLCRYVCRTKDKIKRDEIFEQFRPTIEECLRRVGVLAS